jgi:hypothetical protein
LSVVAALAWRGLSHVAGELWLSGRIPSLSVAFDEMVALILAPGMTFIALAGAIKCAMKRSS